MSDENTNEVPETEPAHEESSGDASLDKRLAEGVLKGDQGIEAAQVWIAAFLIVAAGFIAYSTLWNTPFHALDQQYLRDNANMHAFASFAQADMPKDCGPLARMSLAINWALTPDWPLMFYLKNISVHLLNGVLLFLLCRLLLGAATGVALPMVAGMLLVLHPAATESLHYAVARSGLMATFFMLLSLLLFVWTVQKHGKEEVIPRDASLGLAAALLCYVLAWASSYSALALPLIAYAMYRRPRRDDDISLPRCALGSAFVAGYTVVAVMLIAVHVGIGESLFTFSQLLDYVKSGLPGLTVFPHNLTVLHAVPDPLSVAAGIAMLVLAILVLLVTRNPLSAAGAAWVLGTLALASGQDAGERGLYVSIAGVALFAPWALNSFKTPGPRAILGLGAAALIIMAGIATSARNGFWLDEEVLWTDAMVKAPDSAVPPATLGRLALSEALAAVPEEQPSLFASAEDSLRVAVEKDPSFTEAKRNLGITLVHLSKGEEAATLFLDLLRDNIDDADSALFLARIRQQESGQQGGGRASLLQAADYYRRADTLSPLTEQDLAEYALTLYALGDIDGAEPILRRAAQSTQNAAVKGALTMVQDSLKRSRGLERQALAALKANPADVVGQKTRAQAMVLRGQTMQAFYALDGVLRARPDDAAAWVLMGFVCAKIKSTDHFLEEWGASPPTLGNNRSAWAELASVCAAGAEWDAAQQYLETPAAMSSLPSAPPYVLAEIATQLRQPARARDILTKLTEKYPTNPEPWLRMSDLAFSMNDQANAEKYLQEAQSRGASPQDIKSRKERLAGQVPVGEGIRTVIK